jgi:hypothetical protein
MTARYSATLRDQNEVPIPGALVTVTDYTGAAATLTNDDSSALANPFYTDALGGIVFNTAAGFYTFEYRYGGRLILRDRSVAVGVPVPDPALNTLGLSTGAAFVGSSGPSNVQADLNARPTFTQLLASTGASLISFAHAFAGAPLATLQAMFRQQAWLHQFRKGSETDDTLALVRARALGYPIRLVAGQGSHASGDYQFQTTAGSGGTPDAGNIGAGDWLFGDGIGRTKVRRRSTATTGDYCLLCDSGSALAANNLKNIRIGPGIEFYDASPTFAEFNHLVSLNGVTDAIVEGCGFTSPRGDGLYIGSGQIGGLERHNVNVTIRNNVFDGVDNQNRNAISAIDFNGLTIEGNKFIRFTKLDASMPGPIDIEPDNATTSVNRNLKILFNRFENCGGTDIALLLKPNSGLTNPSENFLIFGNEHINSAAVFAVFGETVQVTLAASTRPLNVRYLNNSIRSPASDSYFTLSGAFGVRIAQNAVESACRIAVGYNISNRDIVFEDNRLTRAGLAGSATAGETLLIDKDVIDVTFRRNRMLDCGKADGTQGWIVYLRGAAANVTRFFVDENTVENPGAKTTAFLRVAGGYGGTVDAASRAFGNTVPAALVTASNLSLTGPRPGWLKGSTTSDVASIAAQSVGVVNVTVTGAALGDTASASTSTALEAGLGISAVVTAADTVQVRLSNPTAGAIDPASRTYYANVQRVSP